HTAPTSTYTLSLHDALPILCIAMQRLHVDDLAGILIEGEGHWPKLVLPAIATEAADYVTGPDEVYHRPAGELLQPDRDSFEAIEDRKSTRLNSSHVAISYAV